MPNTAVNRVNMNDVDVNVNTSQREQWTQHEDESIRQLVHIHGTSSWTLIAQLLPGRTNKQCRERWHNHLDKDICKDKWSVEEDRMLVDLHGKFGNKWADVAKYFQGRTGNAVKNRWNSALRRGERVHHLFVDDKIPSASPYSISSIPGNESAFDLVPCRPHTVPSELLAIAFVETGGGVANGLNPSARGIQVAELFTPSASIGTEQPFDYATLRKRRKANSGASSTTVGIRDPASYTRSRRP